MQPLASTLQVFPSYRLLLAHLSFELGRARRYRHSLAVAVILVKYDQHKQRNRNLAPATGDSNPAFHLFVSFLGSVLRDNLRASDIIAYDTTKDRYVILLPETTTSEAESAVLRLSELVFERMAIPLRIGIAEFPANGLTIDDLINYAETRCNHRLTGKTQPQLDTSDNNNNGTLGQEPVITEGGVSAPNMNKE